MLAYLTNYTWSYHIQHCISIQHYMDIKVTCSYPIHIIMNEMCRLGYVHMFLYPKTLFQKVLHNCAKTTEFLQT